MATGSKQRLGKYFYIRSQLSGNLILDIKDGIDKPGSPVVTSEPCDKSDNDDHQQWFCDETTGTIRNKLNHFCLDLQGDMLTVHPFQRGKSTQQWMIRNKEIQSKDDFEIVLGVSQDDPSAGSPILASQADGSLGQAWTFEHRPAQYFYIRSQAPDKVLDVRKQDPKPGAQVIIWLDKGDLADNQLWYEDESGLVRSKLNGFCLDASGKHVTLMPPDNKSKDQQWVVGGNTLQSRVHPDHVLQAEEGSFFGKFKDTPLIKADFHGQVNQLWFFDYLPDQSRSLNHGGNGKHFIIRSRVSGLVVEVDEARPNPGTLCVLNYRSRDGAVDHQLFYMDQATGTIRTSLNEYCLDVTDRQLAVNPYDPYCKQQQWLILGKKIQNKSNANLVLGTEDGQTATGTRMVAGDYENKECQHWEITYVPAKCFYIISLMHGKVLDVGKEDCSAGARVIMYDKKPGLAVNQIWYEDERGIIRSKLNGYVIDATAGAIRSRPYDPTNKQQQWIVVGDRIQNKEDRQSCLDIERESKKNGASVLSYKYHGKDNQRWSFEYV